MRAALYARVSTEEQAEKYGLSSQLRELRAVAKREGYTIVAEYVDDGVSGATLDRPQLARLREAARARAFDVVLVHAVDRLSRDLLNQLIVTEELRSLGIRIALPSGLIEDSPEAQALVQMQGVVAGGERHRMRERTTRGRREKARKGLVVAGPWPYGYCKDGNQQGGLGEIEGEARIVRQMFAWFCEGVSIRQIVSRLNKQGIPPRRSKRWGKSSVFRILTSETYAGTCYFNRRQRSGGTTPVFRSSDQWITIPVTPIVDRTTFERVQQQIARNKVLLSGRRTKEPYQLRGLLVCGLCGKKLAGNRSHGRRMYRCTGHDRLSDLRCRAREVPAERVEQRVWTAVEGVLRNPRVLMPKVRHHGAKLEARIVAVHSEIEHLERERSKVQDRLSRLLNLAVDGRLGNELFQRKQTELADQLSGIEGQLAHAKRLVAQDATEGARQGALERLCATLWRGLKRATPEDRQRCFRLLIDKIVCVGGRLEIHGVIAPPPPESDPAVNCPAQAEVVPARGGDLEGALGGGLAADVGEVAGGERRRGEEGRGVDRGRGADRVAAEMRDRLGERLDADDRRAARERGLGGVGRRDDEAPERRAARRCGDGEGAAHAVHAAVEPELAEDAPAGEVGQAEVAEGGEEREGDRQVERRALLAHARGAQVDGHPALGVLEAAVAERRPDALRALAHGAAGQADGGRVREAGGHVDLDVDDERVDAAEGARADAGRHGLPRAAGARLA